jgi:hypothetical protein
MFSGIMEKLGFEPGRRGAGQSTTSPPPAMRTGTAEQQGTAQKPAAAPGPEMPPRPAPQTEVDVLGKLEALAAANPQKLNWRQSIVDLLKLLGMDSSLAARKELATELGCPPEKMGDSAQMNMWLHKTVLQKLADNGGNIPKELLH